jgi:hypothetical protein
MFTTYSDRWDQSPSSRVLSEVRVSRPVQNATLEHVLYTWRVFTHPSCLRFPETSVEGLIMVPVKSQKNTDTHVIGVRRVFQSFPLHHCKSVSQGNDSGCLTPFWPPVLDDVRPERRQNADETPACIAYKNEQQRNDVPRMGHGHWVLGLDCFWSSPSSNVHNRPSSQPVFRFCVLLNTSFER